LQQRPSTSADPRPLPRVAAFADAIRQRVTALDRRLLLAAGAVVMGVGVVAGVALSAPRAASVAPSASPTAMPTNTPFRARATPAGTPAPRPSTFIGLAASIPVPKTVPTPPLPTPTPEPGLWRFEGYVVDEDGKPIENVCIVLGPVPCAPYSPKTDERGHYHIDLAATPNAATPLEFDVFFEIPGRETKWLRLVPTSSTVFNLMLRRSP
jgi:hypothetical protein